MEIIDSPNYLIYKDGKIFNKKNNRVLKTCINPQLNYYETTIKANKGYIKVNVHRLIAQYYLPNPLRLPCVDHIDRNTLNNNIENLRWVSCLKNSHNTGKYSTNTSGHKNLNFRKARSSWRYVYRIKGDVIFCRQFKNKINCLCYKFICLLRQPKIFLSYDS